MRKLLITLLLLITAAAFSQNGSFTNLDVRSNARVRNNLTLDGNAYLVTTSATDGIIYQNGSRLLHNKGTFNTFLGTNAGNLTNTGNGNIGIGLVALLALTNGEGNNAIGISALSSTTTGDWNVADGYNSLLYNTTGSKNIGIGYSSLYSNVANNGSIAIGYEAMIYADDRAVGQSTYNIALGNYALSGSATAANNTGTENIAIGEQAITNNITGVANIGIGRAGLNHNTSGSNNVCIGSFAGWNNETGSENTAVGKSALSGVYTKSQTGNSAFGYNSLFSIGDNGNYNVAIGHGAGYSNVTGDNNIFLGYQAGYNETGGNKLYIENSNSAAPLIYGDFAADSVVINGDLNVTGNFIYEQPHAFLNYKVTGNDTIGGASAGNLIAIANRWEWTKFALGFADTETHTFTLIATDTLRYDGTLAAHIKFDVPITTDGGNGNDFEMCIYNATDGAIVSTRQAWTTTGTGNKNSITVSAYDVNANPGDKYVLKVRNLSNADDLNVFYCDIFAYVVHFE